MADYESKLMTKDEIIAHYTSLDEPEKICPLYQGEPQDWGLKPRG